jgi:hypothetical protein
MPVYLCRCGAYVPQSLMQPGCVNLRDACGRNWLCAALPPRGSGRGWVADAASMLSLPARPEKFGCQPLDSGVMVLDCVDMEDLRRQLMLATYPPAEYSRARVLLVGWRRYGEARVSGKPVRVTTSSDHETVEAEGATRDEAWWKLAQQVLGPAPEEK